MTPSTRPARRAAVARSRARRRSRPRDPRRAGCPAVAGVASSRTKAVGRSALEFAWDETVQDLRTRLLAFMQEHVYPAEPTHREQVGASGDPYSYPPVMDELKQEARARGLWNLFLTDGRWGSGLTN